MTHPRPSPLQESIVQGPLGLMHLMAADEGLCLVQFLDGSATDAAVQADVGRRRMARLLGRPVESGAHPLLDEARRQLAEYMAGTRRAFDIPVLMPGTPFEQRVWAVLRSIPHGSTQTYAQVARAAGSPGASRATGSANGRNRVAVIVPCHRVIQAHGGIGGFSAGVWRKQWLLDLERTGHPPQPPQADARP
jgi:AraC family transcriptional regulator of adaptative response/methylated-DNA-[protein]-cysteine methyltransferase